MSRASHPSELLRSSALALLCIWAAAGCGEGSQRGAREASAPGADAGTPAAETAESGFVRRAWLASDSFEHEFGAVYPQALQHATFECTVAGEEPLVVRELKYSCGCTAGELLVVGEDGATSPVELGRPYPTGTRMRLATTLNTKGRTGEQEQKISVVLGDGTIDIFTMRASIEPFLIAEPDAIVLEQVDPFQGARAQITLTAQNGESFRPSLWRKIQGDSLDVELTPEAPDAEGRSSRWRIDLRLAPGSGGETLRPKLIFHADVPNLEAAPEADGTPALQRLEVVVVANVRPVVRAWPEEINLGRMGSEEPTLKQLVLHSDDPEIDFSKARALVVDARGEGEFPYPEACSVSLVARESSSELGLNLEMRPLPRSGPFAGRVVIELDHPLQARVTIPFQGTMP